MELIRKHGIARNTFYIGRASTVVWKTTGSIEKGYCAKSDLGNGLNDRYSGECENNQSHQS